MTQGNWESSPFNTPITLPAASSLTSSPLSVISSFKYSTACLASFVNGSLVQPFPGVAVNCFKCSKSLAILPVISKSEAKRS